MKTRKYYEKEYNEGWMAKSILDNPYWLCYPKDSTSDDESKARHWVDGYFDKVRENANAA